MPKKRRAGWSRPEMKDGVHTAEFVTPTGARYRSTAPPAPGPPVFAVSEIDCRSIAIADLHAA